MDLDQDQVDALERRKSVCVCVCARTYTHVYLLLTLLGVFEDLRLGILLNSCIVYKLEIVFLAGIN